MSKLKKVYFAGWLAAVSAGSFANGVCDGFEVSLKNSTADGYVIQRMDLTNGKLEPGQLGLLKSNTEQVFTVNKANSDEIMEGNITLKRASLPTKTVKIHFSLKDKKAFCEHNDKESSGSVEKKRAVGAVYYTIK